MNTPNEQLELLKKIAKQNEDILKNQREMMKKENENLWEDPYYTNYERERNERGLLS